MSTYFRGSDEDKILNSSNRLTDGFFYCSFNIIEYLSYPKSKTTGVRSFHRQENDLRIAVQGDVAY